MRAACIWSYSDQLALATLPARRDNLANQLIKKFSFTRILFAKPAPTPDQVEGRLLRNTRQGAPMKFGIFYEHQLPRPWNEGDEHRLFQEALDQVELADKLGIDYAWEVEHRFLEEYSHSSAPEIFLAAASQRTKNIRLGHGICLMPPRYNHPARVAERIATLDLVSDGRVEFGTGESASEMEMGGFGVRREEKKGMWEEATRECVKMMSETPYSGVEGAFVGMPSRNVIPKPLQKPHPPLWVASSRRETTMVAARLGMGSLGFAFETPEEAQERVEQYFELIREECTPIGVAINPALAVLSSLSCFETDEEA